MEGKTKTSELPPGFRFHPTDEELITYYLQNQAKSRPCPVSIIPEIDIYKFDPWELPAKAEFGEKEWYFFSPRDRKYPNGVRPNRATGSGYWKATGTDKAIHSGSKNVGVKKSLVFYKGRPPKGVKTDWIMHEYRLGDSRTQTKRQNGSMRLDDWVLCRIYRKRQLGRLVEQKDEDSGLQIAVETAAESEQQRLIFPRTVSLSYLLEAEYLSSISNLLSDHGSFNSAIGFHQTTNNGVETGINEIEKLESDNMVYQFTSSTKLEVNQNSFLTINQPTIIANPVVHELM